MFKVTCSNSPLISGDALRRCHGINGAGHVAGGIMGKLAIVEKARKRQKCNNIARCGYED